ncbi:acyl carrier protein [Streptomyces sp. NPDC023327]|uniref:acyl carrier protein n=1 Tax=Streptomyces sp. NPDC023327 TaxID=3157088 RepID=UPI0033DD9A59
MTREDIVRALHDLIQDVTDVPVDRFDENTAFIADLGLDSLRMVQIVVRAEDAFGVTISDEDAWELRTVCDAVTYIERALESAALRRTDAPAPAHSVTFETSGTER